MISLQAENSPCLTPMYAVTIHYKYVHLTSRLQLCNKTVLGLRQWRNWQRGICFISDFSHGSWWKSGHQFSYSKVQGSWENSFPSLDVSIPELCVVKSCCSTLCTLTPLCNSVVTSPAERRVVSGLAPERKVSSLKVLDHPNSTLQKCFKSSIGPWDLQAPSHHLASYFCL